MLKNEIISLALQHGGDLIGFASAERFHGSPRGHHPQDFVSQAKTVISLGLPVPRQILNYEHLLKDSELVPPEMRKEYLQKYYYRACGYTIINELLELLSYKITCHLEKRGHSTTYFTATYGNEYEHIQNMMPGGKGIFSHRHAAVKAGLGEFGLNNVVVTPEYGPRARFNSIVTDADIEPDPLLQEKACLGLNCKKCLDKCGTGAIKFTVSEKDIKNDKVWGEPVTTTEVDTCKNGRIEAFCLGRCLNVCPAGK